MSGIEVILKGLIVVIAAQFWSYRDSKECPMRLIRRMFISFNVERKQSSWTTCLFVLTLGHKTRTHVLLILCLHGCKLGNSLLRKVKTLRV